MPEHDTRSRLPWLIGAGILIVLIVAAGGFLLGRTGSSVPPSSSAPTSPDTQAAASTPALTSPSGTSDGDAAAPPSGCLGGQDRTVATVLAAQKQAGHTAFGAADLLATYFRWGFRYPYPSAADVAALAPMYSPSSAETLEKSATNSYRGPYRSPAGGQVPTGTPYYLSMASGLWTVAEGSTSQRVTVSVQGNYVIDDVFSPTKSAGVTATFLWQDNVWRVSSFDRANLEQLAAGGTTFTSGC